VTRQNAKTAQSLFGSWRNVAAEALTSHCTMHGGDSVMTDLLRKGSLVADHDLTYKIELLFSTPKKVSIPKIQCLLAG